VTSVVLISASDTLILAPPFPGEVLPVHQFFDPTRPLEIDVGCGKGAFLIARAKRFPTINYLGIDRKLSRLRNVARKIVSNKLCNARLLYADAADAVGALLPPAAVSTFYVLFPDPWPKRRHHRRRLFSPGFVDSLYRTLVPRGVIHITTDHSEYFESIVQLFRADGRFEQCAPLSTTPEEWSNFERVFQIRQIEIKRASFLKLDASPGKAEAASSNLKADANRPATPEQTSCGFESQSSTAIGPTV
ncbi:MAG: tRNA (guanosine(46)-N7)-methyltransferase TrmB, partial [Kiritimatiellia bacterium]